MRWHGLRWDRAMIVIAVSAILAWGLGATDDKVKIGVVDLDQAITSTDEGRAARDEFERKKREAEATLQPMVERYQELNAEMEAKQFVLSKEALRLKQLDLADLVNQIQNKQKEIQGQLEIDRERLVGPLRVKLAEIVEEVGRKESFSIILLRNAPGVMYSREALDVTDLIIERFNKKG